MNRRSFIQTASLAALAASLSPLRAQTPASAAAPRYRNLISPNRKLRIAGIGVGGKGSTDLLNCADEEIVALCDVDFKQGNPSFLRWPTPHTAVEYHRWGARSSIRPDGLSYMSLMEAPVQRRVLQVQGALDPMMLAASVDGSEQYVRGDYRRADLDTGHFPHEEDPDAFNAVLLDWLGSLDQA